MTFSSKRKSLVIDANIARAAGESKRGPSTRCGVFLESVREFGHRIVLTREISSEWHEHSSRFSENWLATMQRTNSVVYVHGVANQSLRESVKEHATDIGSRDAMLKDIRLLEAALKTDRNVASMDERARGHFGRSCRHVEEIRDITWVNPDTESEYCLDWLRRGAPTEPKRLLGHTHREH